MLLYRLLLSLAAPVLLGLGVLRVLRGTERLSHLSMRLGGGTRHVRDARTLWIHGASNGELTAARSLIRALQARQPDLSLLITCNTPSALSMIQGWGLHKAEMRLAPLDLRWSLARMLAGRTLAGFVLLEADFWPNRIALAKAHKVPCVLLSGRMSARSAKGWARRPGLAETVLTSFDLILPQDAASAARFLALGASSTHLGPLTELKSAYYAQPCAPNLPSKAAPLWLCASTHEGEDTIVLEAHGTARQTIPNLRLIIAPRHPKRGEAITRQAQAQGFDTHRLSRRATLPDTWDVLVADTLGEMPRWYSAAPVCFVGGSLVQMGGHTPFEPIAHDCAVLHGPHVENFTEVYKALQLANACMLIRTSADLAKAVVCLADPEQADPYIKRAKTVVAQTNATIPSMEKTLDALENLICPTTLC